ncbi:MAG: thiol peroxidase [Chlamydiales bacterium]|nr:thiol peroxidase [Chlamydiales bacterium]
MSRQITIQGKLHPLIGKELALGKKVPDCKVVDEEMQELHLSSLFGKVTLVLTVPSIDTSVCQEEAKRFNAEVALWGPSVRTLVVSEDLPFAQKRWCGAEGAKNLKMVSDFRFKEFGDKWGVRIQDVGLLARAVFLLNADGVLHYMQIVEELSNVPDFQRAIDEVDALLSSF